MSCSLFRFGKAIISLNNPSVPFSWQIPVFHLGFIKVCISKPQNNTFNDLLVELQSSTQINLRICHISTLVSMSISLSSVYILSGIVYVILQLSRNNLISLWNLFWKYMLQYDTVLFETLKSRTGNTFPKPPMRNYQVFL